jgi:hypothetical protein
MISASTPSGGGPRVTTSSCRTRSRGEPRDPGRDPLQAHLAPPGRSLLDVGAVVAVLDGVGPGPGATGPARHRVPRRPPAAR